MDLWCASNCAAVCAYALNRQPERLEGYAIGELIKVVKIENCEKIKSVGTRSSKLKSFIK